MDNSTIMVLGGLAIGVITLIITYLAAPNREVINSGLIKLVVFIFQYVYPIGTVTYYTVLTPFNKTYVLVVIFNLLIILFSLGHHLYQKLIRKVIDRQNLKYQELANSYVDSLYQSRRVLEALATHSFLSTKMSQEESRKLSDGYDDIRKRMENVLLGREFWKQDGSKEP